MSYAGRGFAYSTGPAPHFRYCEVSTTASDDVVKVGDNGQFGRENLPRPSRDPTHEKGKRGLVRRELRSCQELPNPIICSSPRSGYRTPLPPSPPYYPARRLYKMAADGGIPVPSLDDIGHEQTFEGYQDHVVRRDFRALGRGAAR